MSVHKEMGVHIEEEETVKLYKSLLQGNWDGGDEEDERAASDDSDVTHPSK